MKKLFLFLICSLFVLRLFAATNYPGSLDSYSTKNATDTISEGHINDPQDAIEALEAKVGTGASTPADGTVLCGNGAGATAYEDVNLADAVTGTLPIANGGTGTTTSLVKKGTYTGDGQASKTIAHGLGAKPDYIFWYRYDIDENQWAWINGTGVKVKSGTGLSSFTTEPDATNFYVNSGTGNTNNGTYTFIAIKAN